MQTKQPFKHCCKKRELFIVRYCKCARKIASCRNVCVFGYMCSGLGQQKVEMVSFQPFCGSKQIHGMMTDKKCLQPCTRHPNAKQRTAQLLQDMKAQINALH